MLKFKCPNCSAELALGHMAVNPTPAVPPFHYWPRDLDGVAARPRTVELLQSIPEEADVMMDSAGTWWMRDRDNDTWREVPAERVPQDTFPPYDPHAPLVYQDPRSGTVRLALGIGEIPPESRSFTSRLGQRWTRSNAGEAWAPCPAEETAPQ